MITILIALLVFGVIIAIHEFGHFIVAKLCGIKVNQFAIGMGPVILRKQGKETEYSLRLFPVGGFCAMEGEDAESNDPRAFNNNKVWKRVLVVIAGAVMNIILGFVVILVTTCLYGDVITTEIAKFPAEIVVSEAIPSCDLNEGDRIISINNMSISYGTTLEEKLSNLEGETLTAVVNRDGESVALTGIPIASLKGEVVCASTSNTCGLQAGDTIVKIDGMRIFTDADLSYKLQTSEAETVDLVVKRDGKLVTLPDVAFRNTATEGKLDFYVTAEKLTFFNTIEYSALSTVSTGRLIWISLKDLVTGKYGFNDMSGPVGIIGTIGEAAKQGSNLIEQLISVLSLASFITINVGIFNLLPLPALDGGRLVFLIVEAIRRKPVKPEHEGMVHFIGFALLILLMVAVTFQDILKLIQG